MVDCKSLYAGVPDERPNLVDPGLDSRTWVTDCTCNTCHKRRQNHEQKAKAIWADYDLIQVADLDKLTEHMQFLLPPVIWAFVFKTRSWGEFPNQTSKTVQCGNN